MLRALILRLVKNLVSFQMGQSRIRKLIPVRVYQQLKVYKYNFWLLYTTLTRDSSLSLVQLIKFLRQNRKRILFYPDIPWETSVISLFCLQRGYFITNRISGNYDAAFKWRDATFYQPDEHLLRLAATRPVVNVRCNDISKARVDKVFEEVFGYSTIVDPRTFVGKCVQKSDINAKHDGRLVECPIENPEEGAIYQILVDSRIDDDHVMDIRVPVYKNVIPPTVVLWIKPARSRFEVDLGERCIVETSKVFSQNELELIIRFSQKMGLEYGELDVLRDRTNGRIYILDANITPDGGEIIHFLERDDQKSESLLFEEVYLGS